MATSAMKTPLLRVASRGFAAQAAPQSQASSQQSQKTSSCVLPNKTVVTSIEQGGGLSRVSVIFRAGPRNETPEDRGISHVVRSAVGLSTAKYTGFGIVRNVQQNGGILSCSGDREVTSINLTATRDNVGLLLPFLAATTEPSFKPWEITDNLPRLKYEISGLTAQTRALDILHKAAYRTGLGNSIFLKKDHVGAHNSEQLQHFFKSAFGADRCSVVGVNVDQSQLVAFAQGLSLGSSSAPKGNSTFFGGEVRKDKNSHFTSVAIAGEGAGLQDQKAALAFAVLQNALGSQPNAKWGGSQSALGKAVSSVAPVDVAAAALNISYSDSGLFGIFISTTANNAGRVVEAAYKVLRSGSVSDADVARGKAQLKAKILLQSENGQDLLEDAGVQGLLSGSIIPVASIVEAVDKLSSSDVNNAARKVAGGKLALAGFGNLSQVPYLDQLK